MGEIVERPSSPIRPKVSHPVGSRTEVRSLRSGVRSRGEARAQAAVLNSERSIVVDHGTSSGNRTQSRHYPVQWKAAVLYTKRRVDRTPPGSESGACDKRVTRELGRASRLLGSNSRSKGDRHNQHPGVCWPTRPSGEPTPAQAGRDTNLNALTQGTGREPKANRPGRTKAVVATHSTAGQGTSPARKRGEPRPKGPTITLAGAQEGNAGHDHSAKERQEGH
jgi:hypothetical protein